MPPSLDMRVPNLKYAFSVTLTADSALWEGIRGEPLLLPAAYISKSLSPLPYMPESQDPVSLNPKPSIYISKP